MKLRANHILLPFCALALVLNLFGTVVLAADCDDICSVPGDCTNNLCKGCQDSICVDCCSFGTQGECENDVAGCVWEGQQCHNVSGVICGGISEVPVKSRTWMVLAFILSSFGLTAFLKLRKRSNSKTN